MRFAACESQHLADLMPVIEPEQLLCTSQALYSPAASA